MKKKTEYEKHLCMVAKRVQSLHPDLPIEIGMSNLLCDLRFICDSHRLDFGERDRSAYTQYILTKYHAS